MEDTNTSRPKSIKQIRQIRKKQPKLIQDSKKTLILRGNKTSQATMKFMKDIKALKKNNTTYYSKKHDTHPFESVTEVEFYCKNTQSSLFLFGSNSKKRPDNIIIGRTFQYQVLDLLELGILSIESIDQFQNVLDIPVNCRPFLIFQGDLWQTEQNFTKARNLLQDFFVQNISVPEIQINNAIRLVITFTAVENKIYMRTYEVDVKGQNILEGEGKLSIQQTGPKVDFIVRRTKFADDQTWKQSIKVPKPVVKKHDKNITRDNIGDKRGKLYVDTQNFDNLGLKKRKVQLQEKLLRKQQEKKQRVEQFKA